ncbi:ribosomal RNA processing protein 36 homolog [Anthonomus grandis grandis]|uniref:ribosomal RNA processing protein 36 homolog n=1 Tax=Anthonomus grandis grandis TaxID=2921223 RepID=UPI0021652D57|nr:ribosomal RNA processing protein 36 homolog [Anthonomus grandis grandis]
MSDNDSTDASGADEKDNQQDRIDEDEPERQKIRENLSTLSFQELIELKEKLGSKVYNETLFGQSALKKKKTQKELKRTNKNRPREISSKIRPKQIRTILNKNTESNHIRKVTPRDPRFDPSCGEFDKTTFKQNYHFINDLKKNEKVELQKEYNECTDPDRKHTIKLLIQRIENQLREEEKANKEKQKEEIEREEIREKRKQGEKPVFKKKSVKKLEGLVEKYEELKKTNRLEKHILKRTKKMQVKDRKIMAKIK